jgi:hypothetical protein
MEYTVRASTCTISTSEVPWQITLVCGGRFVASVAKGMARAPQVRLATSIVEFVFLLGNTGSRHLRTDSR